MSGEVASLSESERQIIDNFRFRLQLSEQSAKKVMSATLNSTSLNSDNNNNNSNHHLTQQQRNQNQRILRTSPDRVFSASLKNTLSPPRSQLSASEKFNDTNFAPAMRVHNQSNLTQHQESAEEDLFRQFQQPHSHTSQQNLLLLQNLHSDDSLNNPLNRVLHVGQLLGAYNLRVDGSSVRRTVDDQRSVEGDEQHFARQSSGSVHAQEQSSAYVQAQNNISSQQQPMFIYGQKSLKSLQADSISSPHVQKLKPYSTLQHQDKDSAKMVAKNKNNNQNRLRIISIRELERNHYRSIASEQALPVHDNSAHALFETAQFKENQSVQFQENTYSHSRYASGTSSTKMRSSVHSQRDSTGLAATKNNGQQIIESKGLQNQNYYELLKSRKQLQQAEKRGRAHQSYSQQMESKSSKELQQRSKVQRQSRSKSLIEKVRARCKNNQFLIEIIENHVVCCQHFRKEIDKNLL